MKTLAVALSHVLIALVVAGGSACSTATSAKKSAVIDDEAANRAALVKELNALVAQGPLYFETDTDALTDGSQVLLQRVAAQMHRVPRVRVVIGGHADERGDTAYNLALGERRAQTAREYLMRLGIPKERVKIVSLGEEQPVALAHNEDAWSQNRRDEFTFLLPGEHRSVMDIGVIEDAARLVATTTFMNGDE
jgi:peptidoglycan-associated lipoprotein